MHPLEPTVLAESPVDVAALGAVELTTSPHWPLRGWHYHTQHPLEMVEVFNGFDISTDSTDGLNVTWEAMVPEVDLFFQWCLANRQVGFHSARVVPIFRRSGTVKAVHRL
jgi:hypothetical protein